MKIIIATGIFPPDIGGPATYVERLALELIKRKIKVKVITYADRGQPSALPRAALRVVPITRISRSHILPIRYLLYFWKLLLLAKSADIIYAQCPIGSGLPSLLVSKILGRKFVLKITGDYAWEQYCQRSKASLEFSIFNFQFSNLEEFQKGKYDLITEMRRKIQKFTANNADKIIVPSQYLKKIVQRWGIEKDKITVVYNAIGKLPELDISKKEAQEKISIKGDILLSIGRLVPWKGFDTLVEMMPDLLKKNPDFKLIIIGGGPERKKLELQVTPKRNQRFLTGQASYPEKKSKISHGAGKLQDKVFLVGQVSQNELSFYFKAADIFVLNTAYEGLSHIILEAMQMKVPVITTNIGGNPELIQDGYNGILIEYNNQAQLKEAIIKLWSDKDCQQKFIENSLKELEKFKLEIMINETLEVLRK